MSLPIPNLDDRSFDDLMKDVRSLIPRYDREWTNYNPSDPGITLLELFSWLGEMIIYRINRVPEESYINFLKLIAGVQEKEDLNRLLNSPDLDTEYRKLLSLLKDIEDEKNSVEDGKKNSVTEIREAVMGYVGSRYRVITSKDFEEKALICMEKLQKGMAGRAICVNNRDLEYGKADLVKPGHVSVIIIPRSMKDSKYCEDEGKPTTLLKKEVKTFLDARRLITTRVHVVSPFYNDIRLKVRIALKENTNESSVLLEVKKRIHEYFNPTTGGPEGIGWPLGRRVYRSELYHLVERITGVDHVAGIWMSDDATLEIKEHQLVSLSLPDLSIEKVNNE
ncbi:Baseplate J-like protein [Candidatus Methanoperedens nitroreducens]|uniref:Baseplate J-like protein n=1 Tax=Candidatus Methanoperedens nitratireducens TaxID=1392998 RepID=A0A062V567_9EURY|nr:baseplate J/gp47 family protein [Candidatus Methanoperedens nitroreducens]KCZ70545.1 Baseplate J-like protein [Candidatus Methanoperedens nitroreducens]MDJ1420397.1 baseplate J/gp47 family protein [Candidatus Methanoperedens sp.]